MEAEKGLAVLEPGLLPVELPFNHARYEPTTRNMMLYYGSFAPDRMRRIPAFRALILSVCPCPPGKTGSLVHSSVAERVVYEVFFLLFEESTKPIFSQIPIAFKSAKFYHLSTMIQLSTTNFGRIGNYEGL